MSEHRHGQPARQFLEGPEHEGPEMETASRSTATVASGAWPEAGVPVSFSGADATDEELMMRFQGGDRSTLAFLVRRHETRLYNFAARLLGSGPMAEEVVQDTFMLVVQRASEFKHAARFSTWLYSIARNLCVDPMRRRALGRHRSLDEGERAGDGDGTSLAERTPDRRTHGERAAVAFEIRERVLAALEAMPTEQREVFLMRELGSLPFKDIAEMVGVPENTAKVRMRYALERLQAALSELEEYARALR